MTKVKLNLSTRDTDYISDKFCDGMIDCIEWVKKAREKDNFIREVNNYLSDRNDIINESYDLLEVVYNFGWCVMADYICSLLRYDPRA